MSSAALRKRPVVAIDGPAGAGKSTVARMLAQRLGFLLLDTGALYRAVALAARERQVPWDAAPELGRLTAALELRFVAGPDGHPRIFVEGRDRSEDIRTPEISLGASMVSQHREVREALLGLQRRLGAPGGVVVEGRDIGTVVFPDAEVKIFLTADPLARARRRAEELQARGLEVSMDRTLEEVRQRDSQDQDRSVAPLRPADTAVHVDTTDLEVEQVVTRLERLVQQATPNKR